MKKKFLKRTAIIAATAAMATAAVVGAAGCGNEIKRRVYDPDKDPLIFSTQDFDRVFNPFFSTSAMDANAVGMTQISMLGNDKDGNETYGENEAVVTLDYQEETIGTPNVNETTSYYFVLKNNVRFSDGSYLTMKDVFFNLYVYLDPAYTGSSTMYSTDIVGLQQYRTKASSEQEQNAFNSKFNTEARGRILNLTLAMQAIKEMDDNPLMTSEGMIDHLTSFADGNADYAYIVDDYKRAEELFKEELKDDFNNSKDSYEDTVFTDANGKVHKNLFTTDVEVFLYNEGLIEWNKNEAKLQSDILSDSDLGKVKTWDEDYAIQRVYDTYVPLGMDEVINYWATSEKLFVEIAGDAMEKYFQSNPPTEYKEISGIQFINRLNPVTVNGVEYGVPKYEDDGSVSREEGNNEVLKITINGVDPKAKWNFAFGVAPMYYYSDDEHIKNFSFDECRFGVEFGSTTFMNKVVKASSKTGVPVGAGPYMASTSSGRTTNVESGEFLENNIMYFHSNPYYVMGEPIIKNVRYKVVSSNQIMNNLQTGGIDFGEPNAKKEIIDQLRGLEKKGLKYSNIQTAGYGYVGINASKVQSIYVRRAIMHSIDPSRSVKYYTNTAEAIYRPMSKSSWAYPRSATPYYPYIGDPVPTNLDVVYPDYKLYVTEHGYKSGQKMSREDQIGYIKYLVETKAGYKIGSSGLYEKNGDKLRFMFTIAGQETDHPSFTALYDAGLFLTNEVGGFNITTKPDNNALTKLSSGSLAVWAAAWGSTIDPDMYQVYHMESKATSVLNWGYQSILLNTTKYATEYDIIDRLSKVIEKARETNDQKSRATQYSLALDLVMELAVELPMYQRDDLFAYNYFKIDESTFTPSNQRSAFKGLTSDIHKLSLITSLEK